MEKRWRFTHVWTGARCVENGWWGARVGAGRPVRRLVPFNPGERWQWVAWTRVEVVKRVRFGDMCCLFACGVREEGGCFWHKQVAGYICTNREGDTRRQNRLAAKSQDLHPGHVRFAMPIRNPSEAVE